MKANVPSLQTFLSIVVVVRGSNVGIHTLQSAPYWHTAAATPAPPDDITARPTTADRSHRRRCDDAHAPPCEIKLPPAKRTEATPTPATETIDRTAADQTRRNACPPPPVVPGCAGHPFPPPRHATDVPFSTLPAPGFCGRGNGGGAGTDTATIFTAAGHPPPPE